MWLLKIWTMNKRGQPDTMQVRERRGKYLLHMRQTQWTVTWATLTLMTFYPNKLDAQCSQKDSENLLELSTRKESGMNKRWRRPDPQPPPVCAGCPPSAPPLLGTCRSDWADLSPGRPAGPAARRSPAEDMIPNTRTAGEAVAAAAAAAWWSRTVFPPYSLLRKPPPGLTQAVWSAVTHRGRTAANSWIRFLFGKSEEWRFVKVGADRV